MPKTISVALKNHLAQEVTTLVTCWKASLKNGEVFGFTEYDKNLTIDGVVYYANTGYTPSAIASSNNLAVDNLEVEGLLNSDAITEADLIAGIWDYAVIEIFTVNYEALSEGKLHLRKGTLGNVKHNRTSFIAELRGMMQSYANVLGEVTTPTCRAEFCDSRCKLNVNDFTVTGTISNVIDRRNIADSGRTEADGFFKYGLITFTSGANNGYSMEVKEYTQAGGLVELILALPYLIEIGDTYTMVRGCNKTIQQCVSYNNAVNFRGEPHLPGIDKALAYGS